MTSLHVIDKPMDKTSLLNIYIFLTAGFRQLDYWFHTIV